MPAPPRVLIVDASADSRAVLRTLLEHEGNETIESARLDDAALIAQQETPDLIVFDADGELSSGASMQGKADERADAWESLEAWTRRTATPIVVLGTKRGERGVPEGGEFVRKPYHYRALLHKIQGTLTEHRAA